MTASIKASADGTKAIIQVGGVDKVVVGVSGIEAGSFKAGAISPTDLAQELTLRNAQPTTSGTSIDFNLIPNWVKRITVIFNGVSTNGTSHKLVQLGSGSVANTGYASTSVGVNTAGGAGGSSSTAGFIIQSDTAAAVISGQMVLTLVSGNIWTSSNVVKFASTQVSFGGGEVTLSGTLDRVRLTTVNGTDAFDSGSVNILYE